MDIQDTDTMGKAFAASAVVLGVTAVGTLATGGDVLLALAWATAAAFAANAYQAHRRAEIQSEIGRMNEQTAELR